MAGLFSQVDDFDDDLFRNIVSLRKSEDLFDDLSGGDPGLSAVAIEAESRVKRDIPAGLIQRGFHYTCAINYPFETEPFMASRYSDGSFGAWYGSMEMETTIYETAYHTKIDIMNIQGVDEIVIRERAVYLVYCRALLIDLRGKEKTHPELLAPAYADTQGIGRRVRDEGHPGLLAPSARCSGTNAVIFNPGVLANPRVNHYLTYSFDPSTGRLVVERAPGEVILAV